MRLDFLAAYVFFLSLSQLAQALPSFEPCDPATWIVGSNNFGDMGTLGAGAAGTCVITGLPATYNPCEVYTLTVKSDARPLAHKIWAAAGTLTGGTLQSSCRHTGSSKQTSSTFTWKAPSGELASVALKSLCGGLFPSPATLLLSSHNVARNTAAPAFVEGCPVPTSSPVSSSPTSQAPSQSPTQSPTLLPPIGPDGQEPNNNNWRNENIYGDLRIPPGQRIQFNWVGVHSVVRYKNQADWESCAIENAIELASQTSPGSFLFTTPSSPGTVWISCGIRAHCQNGQKVRVFLELPQISPLGGPTEENNWKVQTYQDLTVQRGQEIKFEWAAKHSLVQFANQKDFDNCDLEKAKVIVAPTENGTYVFRASKVGNFWLGCSVLKHCSTGGQKLKIIVTSPSVVGPDGIEVDGPNWAIKPYDDLVVPVGTDLRFSWVGDHSLLQLAELNDFESCSRTGSKVLLSARNPGDVTVNTNKLAAGDISYYACGVGTHCDQGMKVRVIMDRVKIGPDAVFPIQKNNWRAKSYSDLRIAKNTDLTLLWEGIHSVVQFSNQADWEACNLDNATVLASATPNGNLTISFNNADETMWLGCGVSKHCENLGQKFRVFVDADPVVEPPLADTKSPTESPAGDDAAAAGGSDDTGVILGSISGVLIAAAALLYRRRKSRSKSGDDTYKRGLNDQYPEKPLSLADNGNGGGAGNGYDLEANSPAFSSFETTPEPQQPRIPIPSVTVFNRNSTMPAQSKAYPVASVSQQIQQKDSSNTFRGLDYTDTSESSGVEQQRGSVKAAVVSKFNELRATARAQAGTLKKTFAEKREIAMRSFRPIVAIDVPLPPPPPPGPTEQEEQNQQHKTFKPHPMYGQSIKLVDVGEKHLKPTPPQPSTRYEPRSTATSQLPSVSETSTSQYNHQAPTASIPVASHASPAASAPASYAPGSSFGSVAKSTASSSVYSKPPTFLPTAAEMSSPDNFTSMAAKIKQSVRVRGSENRAEKKEKAKSIRRTRAAEQSNQSGLSVIPSGESGSIGTQSSSNPIFETLQEEIIRESDAEPEDTNGVAKPYGSLRNHPLYGRTLSV